MCYAITVINRLFILALALSLTGVGQLPVSACAIAHSRASECMTPQTKTDCERMEMDQQEEPSAKVSAGSKTCCVASEAPAPEAQTWSGSFSAVAVPALVSNIFVATQPFEPSWSRVASLDCSPPLQSVLCTFLI